MRRFTVYLPAADIGEDHVVVARDLSGTDAIRTALELGGSRRVHDRRMNTKRSGCTTGAVMQGIFPTRKASSTHCTPLW